MQKLMILGASILQLPAILKAKEMGLEVIAVDMNKNAIGFRNADICLEISTIDIQGVVAAARRLDIDGIMTLASDMPMRTVAAVAKELGLIGITEETAMKATDKAIMRESLKKANIPVPEFFRAQNYEQYLYAVKHFKDRFIVKPADNSGSRGVFLIRDINDRKLIDYAYEYSRKNSRSGAIVIEDYMEGPEVSVETLSIGGCAHIIAVTDKLTTGAPRFVEMGHSQPSKLPDAIKAEIESVAKAAVKAIGIVDGPSHTEIIVTSDGPKIVELGARLGGDNVTSHLVPLSTGVDLVKCCIQIAMGLTPDYTKKFNMGSAIRYFKTQEGMLACINGISEANLIPGIRQISFNKGIGENVGPINNSSDRIGYVIAQGRSNAEAINICNEALSMISIDITEPAMESSEFNM